MSFNPTTDSQFYYLNNRFAVNSIEVDTAETVIISVDCRVYEIDVTNISGGNLTFTAWDNNSPKRIFIPAFTIFPGSTMTYRSTAGRDLLGGMRWLGSAVGLIGYVSFRQHL